MFIAEGGRRREKCLPLVFFSILPSPPPPKRTVYKGPGSTIDYRKVSVIIIAFIYTRLKITAELHECFRKMKKSRENCFCLLFFFFLNTLVHIH